MISPSNADDYLLYLYPMVTIMKITTIIIIVVVVVIIIIMMNCTMYMGLSTSFIMKIPVHIDLFAAVKPHDDISS